MIPLTFKGLPKPILKISPSVFGFFKIKKKASIKSFMYKKSLNCLPCEQGKSLLYLQELITTGMKRFRS